jgi:hypothetical protein
MQVSSLATKEFMNPTHSSYQMRAFLNFQGQLERIVRYLKDSPPDGPRRISFAAVEKLLENVGLLGIYFSLQSFAEMKNFFLVNYVHEGFFDERMDDLGFSYIMSYLVQYLPWDEAVIQEALGTFPDDDRMRFMIKLCLLVRWIVSMLFHGKLDLQPMKSCRRRDTRYTPGDIGNKSPLILLPDDVRLEDRLVLSGRVIRRAGSVIHDARSMMPYRDFTRDMSEEEPEDLEIYSDAWAGYGGDEEEDAPSPYPTASTDSGPSQDILIKVDKMLRALNHITGFVNPTILKGKRGYENLLLIENFAKLKRGIRYIKRYTPENEAIGDLEAELERLKAIIKERRARRIGGIWPSKSTVTRSVQTFMRTVLKRSGSVKK